MYLLTNIEHFKNADKFFLVVVALFSLRRALVPGSYPSKTAPCPAHMPLRALLVTYSILILPPTLSINRSKVSSYAAI